MFTLPHLWNPGSPPQYRKKNLSGVFVFVVGVLVCDRHGGWSCLRGYWIRQRNEGRHGVAVRSLLSELEALCGEIRTRFYIAVWSHTCQVASACNCIRKCGNSRVCVCVCDWHREDHIWYAFFFLLCLRDITDVFLVCTQLWWKSEHWPRLFEICEAFHGNFCRAVRFHISFQDIHTL